MVSQLSVVELLGKKWFVDERLREFRSVAEVGEPIVFLKNNEMDDMLSMKEIIDDPTKFETDDKTISRLKELFSKAVEGDRTAIEEISKVCNPESEE
jgi:hypothetical protein